MRCFSTAELPEHSSSIFYQLLRQFKIGAQHCDQLWEQPDNSKLFLNNWILHNFLEFRKIKVASSNQYMGYSISVAVSVFQEPYSQNVSYM